MITVTHDITTEEFWDKMLQPGITRKSEYELVMKDDIAEHVYRTDTPPEDVEGFLEGKLEEAKNSGAEASDYRCKECRSNFGIDEEQKELLMEEKAKLAEKEHFVIHCKGCGSIHYFPEDFE